MEDQEFFRRLRRLIGRQALHLGQRCTLVDVLAQEGLVVVRCEEGTPPIQQDQFGQPLRRAAETRQLPIFAPDGTALSEELQDLLRGLTTAAA